MLAPTPRILALSPPAAVRAPRISVAKRIVGAELSLSFPLPRRTAPFLLPRIALYPQSAWWRGCGGLLDGGCSGAAGGGGGCAARWCVRLGDEIEAEHEYNFNKGVSALNYIQHQRIQFVAQAVPHQCIAHHGAEHRAWDAASTPRYAAPTRNKR